MESSPTDAEGQVIEDTDNVETTSDEVIGKVFIVVGPDMRWCLICDGVFTRQRAAEHAGSRDCDRLHKM